MKTIFTFAVSILFFQLSFGQGTVVYDFLTNNTLNDTSVKYQQGATFQIENINLFLYDVTITSQGNSSFTEVPAAFNLLNPEETKSTNIDQETEKVTNDIAKPEENTILKQETGLKSNLNEKINSSEKMRSLDHSLDYLNDPMWAELEDTIASLRLAINRFEKANKNELVARLSDLNAEATNLKRIFDQIETIKLLKNGLISVSEINGLTLEKSIVKTDSLRSIYPIMDESLKISLPFENAFRQFSSAYDAAINNPTILKEYTGKECQLKDKMNPLMDEVKALKKTVDESDYQKIFKECHQLYEALRSNKSFSYVSNPIQACDDEIEFKIRIEPKKDLTIIPASETREFSHKIPVRGGWKIDFSTGAFYSSLKNYSYTTNPVSTDSTRSTISENAQNGIGQLSLGAIMHVYPRILKGFKPTISFGVGVSSTDFTNANFFLGGGVIIGRSERFIISSGITLANIDYLKGAYKLNTEYGTSTLTSGLTEPTLRAGYFVSLTYNLRPKK